MDSLLADLRYAVRNIARRPGFSALAVLTLAVGIGINAVAFTAVNALLFHPFVFKGVDRLGWIMLASPGNPYGQLSYTELAELKRNARAFDADVGPGAASARHDGRRPRRAGLDADGVGRLLPRARHAPRRGAAARSLRRDAAAISSPSSATSSGGRG